MTCVLTGVMPLGLVLLLCGAQGFFLPNVTHLEKLLSKYQQDQPHSRARRAIPRADQEEILMLHNKLRGQVSPPASNMEYMVSARPGAGLAWGLRAGGGVQDPGATGQRGSPGCILGAWLHLSEFSPRSPPSALPTGPPGVGGGEGQGLGSGESDPSFASSLPRDLSISLAGLTQCSLESWLARLLHAQPDAQRWGCAGTEVFVQLGLQPTLQVLPPSVRGG